MKKIKTFLFGVRQTGENVITKVPTSHMVHPSTVTGYMEWVKQYNVGNKAYNIRRVKRGNVIITMENIKMAYYDYNSN